MRKIERLFSYMYTTAPSPVNVDNSRNAPLVRLNPLLHNCQLLDYKHETHFTESHTTEHGCQLAH